MVDFVFVENEFFTHLYSYQYSAVILDKHLLSDNFLGTISEIKETQSNKVVIMLPGIISAQVIEIINQSYLNFALFDCDIEPKNQSKLTIGSLSFCYTTRKFFTTEKTLSLSRKESLILEELFLHRNNFLSREKIHRLVLRDSVSLKSNLPEVYVYRLRKLLTREKTCLKIKRHHYLGYQIDACQPI